jgi:alpha-ketoglutarate-dependent taurine dioxygenase
MPQNSKIKRERPCLQVQSNVVGYWRPGLKVGDHRFSDGWHTDIDYESVPSNATIFLCHSAPAAGSPQSGATSFLDTAAFYASLPDELRRR